MMFFLSASMVRRGGRRLSYAIYWIVSISLRSWSSTASLFSCGRCSSPTISRVSGLKAIQEFFGAGAFGVATLGAVSSSSWLMKLPAALSMALSNSAPELSISLADSSKALTAWMNKSPRSIVTGVLLPNCRVKRNPVPVSLGFPLMKPPKGVSSLRPGAEGSLVVSQKSTTTAKTSDSEFPMEKIYSKPVAFAVYGKRNDIYKLSMY